MLKSEERGQRLTDYYKVKDGEWIVVSDDSFEHKCCDCGLEHLVNYKIIDGDLHINFIRQKIQKGE